jgi:hypothetical protein
MAVCIQCQKPTQRDFYKYCSNACQQRKQHDKFITDWKKGLVSGVIGINVRALSKHLVRFLIETQGEICSSCGWKTKHSITGRVPLEVDHKDGDSENSKESNLRLLCPNCHALTSNFRNLNKGKGRKWRREKYAKTTK